MNTPSKETAPAVRATGAEFENCDDTQSTGSRQNQNTHGTDGLQRRVSYFNSRLDCVPCGNPAVADVLDWIRSEKYRAWIEEMRTAADAAHIAWMDRKGIAGRTAVERAFDDLKCQLPAVTWSGTFTSRRKDGLDRHSGVICIDIDHLEDLDELRATLSLDPHVLFAFRSPSYHGLKVGISIEPDLHDVSWPRIVSYFADCYGARVDPACRDTTRLCFLSHDRELYVNPDAQVFRAKPKDTVHVNEFLNTDITSELVASMLSVIPSRPQYSEWIRIISAVGSVLSVNESIDVLSAWSPEERPGEYEAKLSKRLTRITFGTLVYIAKRHGWHPRSSPRQVLLAHIDSSTDEGQRQRAKMVRVADVKLRSVSWLWRGYVPFGHLTIAEGDPGIGKSTIVVSELPARLSVGGTMPGDERPLDVSNTIILGAEDGIADTLAPRLSAAGADLTRVFVLDSVHDPDGDRIADLSRDVALLRDQIKRCKAKLVVIDPLNAYLGSNVDSYKDTSVRQVLAPLAQLAQECDVAIIGIRHWTKATGGKALYKGVGSIAYAATARVMLQFARDPDDAHPTRRILSVAKSNISRIATSLAYHVESVIITCDDGSQIETSRIRWDGAVDVAADDLGSEPDTCEARGQLAEAIEFLNAYMGEKEWSAYAEDVLNAAMAIGLSKATVHRAKKRLNIRSTHTGQPGQKRFPWVWVRDAK